MRHALLSEQFGAEHDMTALGSAGSCSTHTPSLRTVMKAPGSAGLGVMLQISCACTYTATGRSSSRSRSNSRTCTCARLRDFLVQARHHCECSPLNTSSFAAARSFSCMSPCCCTFRVAPLSVLIIC